MTLRPTSLRLRWLSLSLLVCVCGCITRPPRWLGYSRSEISSSAPAAKVVVTGTGVRLQAKLGAEWQPLTTGEPIFPGAMLRTDSESEAVVELPGGQGVIKLRPGSVVEWARGDSSGGTLLLISSGSVAGSVTGAPIELISSCGGSLHLAPNAGATVPFEFRHGRDAQYLAVMKSLGLQADWAIFKPTPVSPVDFGIGLVHRASVPAGMGIVPEPNSWMLVLVGVALLGAPRWRR
jgi:hypothetical protein